MYIPLPLSLFLTKDIHAYMYMYMYIYTHRTRFKEFTPAQMTRVAWSYARLTVKDSNLFSELETQVESRSDTIDGKNLSLILWSMASLTYRPKKKTLEKAIDRLLVSRFCFMFFRLFFLFYVFL